MLVDTIAGLHFVEVKEHGLQHIEAIEPGGQIRFRYENGSQTKNPVAKVRNATFDVKNVSEQGFDGELVLCCEDGLRPQDILVLSMKKSRSEAIATAVTNAKIKRIDALHVAFREQDKLLGQRSNLTLSTTASAKGYDAYCVLLASGNEFERDVIGRISFYVGCTRAIEYLEVFAHRREGLVLEWEQVLARQAELASLERRQ